MILDLMLPDGSGLDLCRSIKSDPLTESIPIIIFLGNLVDKLLTNSLSKSLLANLFVITDDDEHTTNPFRFLIIGLLFMQRKLKYLLRNQKREMVSKNLDFLEKLNL